MRNILLAGAFVALSVSAARAENWYIAHLGSEPCVAVGNIGDDFHRVFYSTGSMRTPIDVAAKLRRMGAEITASPIKAEGVFAFEATRAGADTFTMVFFKDRDECLEMMDRIEK